jgi:hypothetical protein
MKDAKDKISLLEQVLYENQPRVGSLRIAVDHIDVDSDPDLTSSWTGKNTLEKGDLMIVIGPAYKRQVRLQKILTRHGLQTCNVYWINLHSSPLK